MIPGGHKARYKYPGGPHTDRSDDGKTIAIDSEYARHVYVSAGDVCIFIDPGVPHGVLAWDAQNTHERRCVIQFNVARHSLIAPGQALGTALRNHADADHPASGGAEGAPGWPGQGPPGWDLDEAQFEELCRDLGFDSAEAYVRYKAETSVPSQARL